MIMAVSSIVVFFLTALAASALAGPTGLDHAALVRSLLTEEGITTHEADEVNVHEVVGQLNQTYSRWAF